MCGKEVWPEFYQRTEDYSHGRVEIREITEFSKFQARIVDLEVNSRAAVLNDLVGDVFLSRDFLVEQLVT